MKMTAASQMASPNLAPTSTVSSDCLLSAQPSPLCTEWPPWAEFLVFTSLSG